MGKLREVVVLFVVFCAVFAAPGEKNSEDFEFVEVRQLGHIVTPRAFRCPSSGAGDGVSILREHSSL